MTDNYMIRRAIPDLLDKKYYIPEYQRGYRWEKTQVLDLLQDLYAFFIGDTKGQFYCLQPIVVKEKQMNNELWYEVIDGQQRLTTIRIIMQIYDQLNSNMFTTISHKYTIMYATRPDMVDIFESIKIVPPTSPEPLHPDVIETTPATQTVETPAPIPTTTPLLGQQDIIAPLQALLDPSEVWTIRRVFRVLNTYCPQNEHDQKLISEMERLIVKEFSNGN